MFWNCAVEHSSTPKMPRLHAKVFRQELLTLKVFISDMMPVLNKGFFLEKINANDADLSTCKPDEGEESKTGLRCEVLDERDANDNAP